MADKPRSSRRALLYAMIPMGFILLVIFLVVGGWFRAEEAEEFDTAPLEVPSQSPDTTGETGDAEPDDAIIDDAQTDAAEPQVRAVSPASSASASACSLNGAVILSPLSRPARPWSTRAANSAASAGPQAI